MEVCGATLQLGVIVVAVCECEVSVCELVGQVIELVV